MRRTLGLVATLILVAVLMIVALLLGAWWAPFVLGLAVGALVFTRARLALPVGALIGLLTWGIPLAVDQVKYGIGPAAGALSAILGFGHRGAFSLALTLVVGVLLGVTGAWLGSAARSVMLASRAR